MVRLLSNNKFCVYMGERGVDYIIFKDICGRDIIVVYYTFTYFSLHKSNSIYFADYLIIAVKKPIPCRKVRQCDELISVPR